MVRFKSAWKNIQETPWVLSSNELRIKDSYVLSSKKLKKFYKNLSDYWVSKELMGKNIVC